MRTRGIPPLAKPEISRFPRKELPHMPGSWTTPGRAAARAIAPVRVAFRAFEHVGTQVAQVFAAQWLAYVLPYRRFANTLASANARLRAGADRYSFTVVDFHLLLLAGLPGAPKVLIFGFSDLSRERSRKRNLSAYSLTQDEPYPTASPGGVFQHKRRTYTGKPNVTLAVVRIFISIVVGSIIYLWFRVYCVQASACLSTDI